MAKGVQYVVSVILRETPDSDKFIIVERPHDDLDLAGNWGFPAVTLRPGETPEEGARRVCREKLGCDADIDRFLGIMFQKRNSYDIFLMDIEMVLSGQDKPDVRKADTKNTAYIDQKWTNDPMTLKPAADHGSCCASIFLTDRGLLDRDEWILSLEGSDTVG